MVINCITWLAAYTVNSAYASKCMLIDDICKSAMEQIKHESVQLVLKYKSHKMNIMYENDLPFFFFLMCKTIIMIYEFSCRSFIVGYNYLTWMGIIIILVIVILSQPGHRFPQTNQPTKQTKINNNNIYIFFLLYADLSVLNYSVFIWSV